MKQRTNFGRRSPLHQISLLQLTLYGMAGTFAVDFSFSMLKIPFTLFSLFYFDPSRIINRGEVWRLPAFPFLHHRTGLDFTSIIWFAFSMLIYQVVIRTLENRVGRYKANLFMLMSWAVLAAYGFFTGNIIDFYPVVLGITALAGLYNPNFTIYFYFFIPVRGLVLGILGMALMVYNGVTGQYQYLLILALLLILNREAVRGFISRKKRNQEFTKKINHGQAPWKERHRCEVCGRTEQDVPDMTFRFCSKCEGSFEYCEDHIQNHQHRTNLITMDRSARTPESIPVPDSDPNGKPEE
ncbi:hypothetical protein [Proteiniclasticum sp. QWL-01]|nr:hypothetical protein [Proteiniclasticum sp. QWL-01]UUM10625.1 hypothetical protein NQU17_07975 [Clostridiaceae bacterium HFYG-1003]WFF71960.1 hypothetical protein P6M73_11685 [Proteiniclasticum sp. QWL-01]